MLPGAFAVLVVALVWVSFSDLLYRRIPNRLVLLLLAVWAVHPLLALAGLGPWADEPGWLAQRVGWPLMVAALVFVLGYGLFLLRRVGAGDVKLMAVMVLWAGPLKGVFLMATSLLGGVLALSLPLLGMLELTLAHGVMRLGMKWPELRVTEPLILGPDRPVGIPYGLAIAAGALCTFGLLSS